MPLFRNNSGNLEQIKETTFDLEKKIQKITEENLNKIFNLEFVKTEFQLGHFRIDTLAFDSKSSSFVIIEYKKNKDGGLFDQGLAYREVMLDRSADFITEYNESRDKSLKKSDVNWNQSKIIFVSPSFNKNQKQAANLDLHIELWQIQSYQNDIIEYFPIQINDVKTPIKPKKNETYDEEHHFQEHGSDKTRELYYEIKNKILSLGDNIQPIFRKNYIAFRTTYNFVYIKFTRSMIHVNLALKIDEVQDPKNILRDMSGGHGPGSSRITVKDKSEIPYMMMLIEQSYKSK